MINTNCKVYGVDNFSWVDAPRKDIPDEQFDEVVKYIEFLKQNPS
jgi:hypothetical protein